MTHDAPEPDPVPGEISELLEERSKYLRWLGTLDELEEEVRPEVYEPVASDYRERLGEVESELADHRDELEEVLREREGEKEELAAELEERRRAREEARLRHRVGELDDAAWEERRADLDGRIEELQEALEREESAVDELSEVVTAVAEAAGESGGDGGGAEPAEESDLPEPETPASEQIPTIGGSGSPEQGTGPGAGPAPSEGEGDSEAESGDEPEEESYRDELEFLESLSLDDPDRFDAVSSMLDEDEDASPDGGETAGEGEEPSAADEEDTGEERDGGDRP